MKPWWNTSRDSAPPRVTRRRVGRALVRTVVAGALSLPIPGYASGDQVRLPRTGGAVIEAWAFGTLSGATQPDSLKACDLNHVCALAISSTGGAGTGTGTTIKMSFEKSSQGEPSPNLPFLLTETIDYAHPVTKGVRDDNGAGVCYPVSGVMSISVDASSILVLDMVGQVCQVGRDTTRLVFTGSYATDVASTGTFANADAIGSMSINNPSGLSGAETYPSAADTTWMKASFTGQLLYGN